MKDVIKKLVDIEEQAKIFNEETNRQKKSLEKEISLETKKIYDKYMADAKAEVEKQSEIIKEESQKSFEKNEKKRLESAKKLQEKFDENAEGWVDTIINNVLA
ncbi:MAG: hypothetical protein J1E41_06930 [Ruminococcus sp.]|nr:hypothetical protein [Ruminococcus sp.]